MLLGLWPPPLQATQVPHISVGIDVVPFDSEGILVALFSLFRAICKCVCEREREREREGERERERGGGGREREREKAGE